MSRHLIGEALAARLYAAESAVDSALAEVAALTAALPRARSDAYLSAVAGQKVFDSAAASVVALAEARSHLVQTHRALAALARKLGLDTLAIGPSDKPGEEPVRPSGRLHPALTAGREMVNNPLPNTVKIG